jgi:hypothetical protein
LKGWKLAAVFALSLFFFARFAPTYAISGIDVNPPSIPTDGIVTITISQTVGPLPDVFSSLTVTDPQGDVFSYNGAPFSVSSGHTLVVTFPDPGLWTPVPVADGNTGTDMSGMYHVTGTYLDTSLSKLLGQFVVVHNHGSFSVPEFSPSILLLVGVMIPALLLVRRASLKPPF